MKKKSSVLSGNGKNLQISASTNGLKTPVHTSLKLSSSSQLHPHTTTNKELSSKENFKDKQKSVKNLKLSSSIEFPRMVVKSASQTTVNKKLDEKKLKILEKLGFSKRI